MSSKRDDLQGIRGIAIIAVLLFHFFPDHCPNGYAGVDQFFVLSGFLMMMIFGSKTISWKTSGQFYYRRVKRIAPLYILVVLIALSLTFVVFADGFVSVNVESAKFAVAFCTNWAQRSAENNYFLQLETAFDIFTHTWSLAVEMQFYLIAPLFFYISAGLRDCGSIQFKSFHFAVFAISIIYRNLTEPDFAFNSVLCRLWQFQTGIIAFVVGESVNDYQRISEDETNELLIKHDCNKLDTSCDVEKQHISTTCPELLIIALYGFCLMIALLCLFSPIYLPTSVIQSLSTLSIGVVIAYGASIHNLLLHNRALVFMGDISYALYLVHWPIYCWVKSRYLHDPTALPVGLLASIVLSTLISKTFERWYLKLDFKGIAMLTIACYCIVIVLLINSKQIENFVYRNSGAFDETDLYNAKFPTDLTKEEILHLTEVFAREPTMIPRSCYPRASFGHCTMNSTDLGGVANNSVLILGNSYGDNTLDQLERHFAKFASKMEKLTYLAKQTVGDKRDHVDQSEKPFGCGILEQFSGYGCFPRFYDYFNFTEQYRPDVLFIVARHIPSLEAQITNINNDTALEDTWKQLQKYESIVKKRIYILDAYKIVTTNIINEFRDSINNNQDINTRSNHLYCHECYENTIRRYAEIQKRCTKCVVYSYMDTLSDAKGNFLVADPRTRLPLFHSSSHLTPMGQSIIDGVYEKLADKLEKEIVNGSFV